MSIICCLTAHTTLECAGSLRYGNNRPWHSRFDEFYHNFKRKCRVEWSSSGSLLCLSHARCRQTVLSQAVAQRCHPSQVMRSRSYYSLFSLDLLVFIEIARKSAIFMIPLWSLQICFLPARHNLRWFQDHSTRARKWSPDHLGTFRCHRQKCRKIFARCDNCGVDCCVSALVLCLWDRMWSLESLGIFETGYGTAVRPGLRLTAASNSSINDELSIIIHQQQLVSSSSSSSSLYYYYYYHHVMSPSCRRYDDDGDWGDCRLNEKTYPWW